MAASVAASAIGLDEAVTDDEEDGAMGAGAMMRESPESEPTSLAAGNCHACADDEPADGPPQRQTGPVLGRQQTEHI